MTCYYTDDGYSYIDPTFRGIASFFLALSASIASFGNIFCLLVLWQPSQRSKSNKILTSLAISDCMCGLINIPFAIYMIQRGHTRTDIVCWKSLLVTVVIMWSIGTSAYTIIFITYNRYLHIAKPSRYNELLSDRRVNSIIVFIWIAVLLGSIGAVLYWAIYIFVTSLFFIGTIIALIVGYFLIWRAVRQSQRRIAASSITRDTHRENVRLAKKVSIIVIFYLVAFIPSLIYIILSLGFHVFSNQAKSMLYVFSLFTVFSNSAVNPFLYAWKDPAFKTTCKRLLKKNKVTALFVKNSSETTVLDSRSNGLRASELKGRSCIGQVNK